MGSWIPSANEGGIYRRASDRVIIQTAMLLLRVSREEYTKEKSCRSFLFFWQLFTGTMSAVQHRCHDGEMEIPWNGNTRGPC
jgi:hypothetical protein